MQVEKDIMVACDYIGGNIYKKQVIEELNYLQIKH